MFDFHLQWQRQRPWLLFLDSDNTNSDTMNKAVTEMVKNPVLNQVLELLMRAAYIDAMEGYLDTRFNDDGSTTFIIDGTDMNIKLTLNPKKHK